MIEETIKGLLYIQELNKKNFIVLLNKLRNKKFKEDEYTIEKEKEFLTDKMMIIDTINNIEKNINELETKLQVKNQENSIKEGVKTDDRKEN